MTNIIKCSQSSSLWTEAENVLKVHIGTQLVRERVTHEMNSRSLLPRPEQCTNT
jgi:hypothetical protein